MSILYYETTNSLKHHGVKGQKWGVRRYQNPDGTLTRAGQKRNARLYAWGKKLDTMNSKIKDRAEDRYGKKSNAYKKAAKEQERIRKQLNKIKKGVSKEDLSRGKYGLVGRTAVSQMLAGPIGTATYLTLVNRSFSKA